MKKLGTILADMEAAKDTIEFIPTGFAKLDNFLDGGFMRKELVVLGGFTGVGKSYFAGQMLLHIATKGFKTAYFSLEISNEMVVSRLVGSIANIKPTRIMAGFLEPDEFESKKKVSAKLLAYEDGMTFYDDLYTFEQIKQEIIKNAYEFVVIDFIQNIIMQSTPDEYSRLSQVTLHLQKLAKETNCCIMLLSQLSNSKAKEGASNGQAEYKGSGGIATACDLGFFIERQEPQTTLNIVNLVLRKNRRGISGQGFKFTFKHPGGWIAQWEEDTGYALESGRSGNLLR